MSSVLTKPNTKKIKELLLYLDPDRETKINYMAKKIGAHYRIVHHVVHGTRICWPIRKKIAKFLNVPLEEIFPIEDAA